MGHIIQSDTMLPQAVFSLLVTLLVLDSCQPTNGSRCPDKWLDASFVQMGCLLFDSSKALDWDDANNFCQFDKNSSLVELKKVEQLYITTKNTLTSTSQHPHNTLTTPSQHPHNTLTTSH